MKTVCAWCLKDLSDQALGEDDNTPISHGICEACADTVLSLEMVTLRKYLDRFSGPVVILSPDLHIIAGNTEGCGALGKEPDALYGLLGGEAIECAYASLPGGCGQTIHCRTCTIRNTVTDTLTSGRGHIRVVAYADLHDITGDTRLRFMISTERIGRTVLLRIDEASPCCPTDCGLICPSVDERSDA